MKKLAKKPWFQMVLSGLAIGIILIIADEQFHFFGSKKSGKFMGPVEAEKNTTYFTSVQFDQTSFDFGKVKEGDTVKHAFTIKNTGDEPLFIYKTIGSCDCVGVRFEKSEPIQPGQQSEILIIFNTKGRNGPQRRTVVITTNTEPSESTLALTGTVE
jgi:hypothetical protein